MFEYASMCDLGQSLLKLLDCVISLDVFGILSCELFHDYLEVVLDFGLDVGDGDEG